jgi:hypothetical protein
VDSSLHAPRNHRVRSHRCHRGRASLTPQLHRTSPHAAVMHRYRRVLGARSSRPASVSHMTAPTAPAARRGPQVRSAVHPPPPRPQPLCVQPGRPAMLDPSCCTTRCERECAGSGATPDRDDAVGRSQPASVDPPFAPAKSRGDQLIPLPGRGEHVVVHLDQTFPSVGKHVPRCVYLPGAQLPFAAHDGTAQDRVEPVGRARGKVSWKSSRFQGQAGGLVRKRIPLVFQPVATYAAAAQTYANVWAITLFPRGFDQVIPRVLALFLF